MLLGRRQVHLDRHGRLAHLLLDHRRDDALDRPEDGGHLLGGRLQGGVVVTEDADREVVVRRGADGRDPVVGVGRHLAAQPRVGTDGRPDGREGGVVVGVVADPQPDLAGVHVDDLVRAHGPAGVRPDRLHAVEPAQFGGDGVGHAVHLGQRGAGRRLEADEHVRVVERGQQRARPQLRDPGQHEDPEQCQTDDRRDGAPEGAAGRAVVEAVHPGAEGRDPLLHRAAAEQHDREHRGHHHRHQERRERRQDEHQDGGPRERAGRALEEEQRCHGDERDQGRVGERAPPADQRRGHQRHEPAPVGRPALGQPLLQGGEVPDDVVHDECGDRRQPEEGHRRQRGSAQPQHPQRRDQGRPDRRERDDDRPPGPGQQPDDEQQEREPDERRRRPAARSPTPGSRRAGTGRCRR